MGEDWQLELALEVQLATEGWCARIGKRTCKHCSLCPTEVLRTWPAIAAKVSHPVLTAKIKCGLCVPRKFNTQKDVISEVTKAILLLTIVKLLHKVFT